VASRETEFSVSRRIGAQLVCDEHSGSVALLLDQPTQELQGYRLISPGLHQQIEYLALTIDRSPEIHASTLDRDDHLVEVPGVRRPRAQPAQVAGVHGPELQDPAPDCLVGDVETTLGEKFLDIG